VPTVTYEPRRPEQTTLYRLLARSAPERHDQIALVAHRFTIAAPSERLSERECRQLDE
jgi:hypothetical protein